MSAGQSGWAVMPWAVGPWAGPSSALLQLQAAVAVAENAVQLRFSQPVYASGLFDQADGLDPSHYAISPVAGTVGMDGEPSRAVLPVMVEVLADSLGDVLQVTTDRTMTAFPSAYLIVVSGLYTADLSHALNPSYAQAQFQGCARQPITWDRVRRGQSQDLAGEPDLALITPNPPTTLGKSVAGIAVVDGDYAGEDSETAYKHRVYRIITTAPGGFLHLGNDFGVGTPKEVKRLGRAAVVAKIVSGTEEQIRRDPETEECAVRLEQDASFPALFKIVVVARRKGGKKAFKVAAPIGPIGY